MTKKEIFKKELGDKFKNIKEKISLLVLTKDYQNEKIKIYKQNKITSKPIGKALYSYDFKEIN